MLDHILTSMILMPLAILAAYGSWMLYERMNSDSPYRPILAWFSAKLGIGAGVLVGVSKSWFYVPPGILFGFSFTLVLSAVVVQVNEAHMLRLQNVMGVRQPWLRGEPPNWSIVEGPNDGSHPGCGNGVTLGCRRVGQRRRWQGG